MKPRLPAAFVIAVAAILCVASVSAQSSAAQAAASRSDTSSPLSRARSALSALSGAELAEALDRTIATLSMDDAQTLVDEFLPKLDTKAKVVFLEKTAGMALLKGAFAEAAGRYESASGFAQGGAEHALRVKAGRCALAAGDAEKASELASLVLASNADQAAAAGARLLSAWTLAYKGKRADALAIASMVAAASRSKMADAEREALFLVWLCSEQKDRAKAAADLAAAFPSSIEARVASGAAATPSLPHWYLGELPGVKNPLSTASPSSASALSADTPHAPASSTQPPTASTPKAPSGSTPATGSQASQGPAPQPVSGDASDRIGRLQVGYFSVEANARRLAAELAAKGFTVQVEARLRPAGPTESAGKAASDQERRWIVLVDAGKDPSATMKKLKDAGYESYGVE
jgi:cell division septation protein DedD